MQKNLFKEKIKMGMPVYGFYLGFPSPELVEFMGYVGFDYVIIDAEHYAFNIETIQDIARASVLTNMTPIVRVPKNDQELILGYLETGIQGIIVPHIHNVAAARAAVEAVKYFPLGNRGAGSGTRTANYGLTQTSTEYFELANNQTVIIALIEDVEGIDNIPEILLVEGIDAVSIGSGDLAMSMGHPGNPNHPEVRSMVEKARANILSSDKALGSLANTSDAAQVAVREGSLFITLSFGAFLGNSMRDFLRNARERVVA